MRACNPLSMSVLSDIHYVSIVLEIIFYADENVA